MAAKSASKSSKMREKQFLGPQEPPPRLGHLNVNSDLLIVDDDRRLDIPRVLLFF